jgi:hypothetical protein
MTGTKKQSEAAQELINEIINNEVMMSCAFGIMIIFLYKSLRPSLLGIRNMVMRNQGHILVFRQLLEKWMFQMPKLAL